MFESDNVEFFEAAPSPEQIKEEIPLPEGFKSAQKKASNEIKDIIAGRDHRMMIVIGPCSIHNPDVAYEYCGRLAQLQKDVSEYLLLIPRVYTNKPRTNGEGYKGLANSVDPLGKADSVEGIKTVRRMDIRIFEETGLTVADEILYPSNYPYISEIPSTIVIGARSCPNQEHRIMCSAVHQPVGIKNPTDGNLHTLLHSVNAVQAPHEFIVNGHRASTKGNPYTYCILRGASNPSGDKYHKYFSNYSYDDIKRLYQMYQDYPKALENPSVVIDCNHDNSGKQFKEQVRIAHEVTEQRRYFKDQLGQPFVKGLMIESNLKEGNIPSDLDLCDVLYDPNYFGKSMTDPCLGWEDSEDLIKELADQVQHSH